MLDSVLGLVWVRKNLVLVLVQFISRVKGSGLGLEWVWRWICFWKPDILAGAMQGDGVHREGSESTPFLIRPSFLHLFFQPTLGVPRSCSVARVPPPVRHSSCTRLFLGVRLVAQQSVHLAHRLRGHLREHP